MLSTEEDEVDWVELLTSSQIQIAKQLQTVLQMYIIKLSTEEDEN
jgi:hypothetical protein